MLRYLVRSIPGARRFVRWLRRRVEIAPPYYYENAYKKIRIDLDVPGFSDLATRVIADKRTLLNYDRLYTLWHGVNGVRPGSNVVEVGVYRGGSARFISEAMVSTGRTGWVYACDTFRGHAVVDSRIDGEHRVHDVFSDVDVTDVQAYLADCENIRLVVGNIMERADAIPDEPIGFIHLDVDVYPPTKFCLDHFQERVDVGGVIIVDDYGFVTCAGAKEAVDEFAATRPNWRFFHLMTGQALLIRIE